jgi:hypothetical protein
VLGLGLKFKFRIGINEENLHGEGKIQGGLFLVHPTKGKSIRVRVRVRVGVKRRKLTRRRG